MVVCYHFQRGTCRFGSSCKFEHANSNYDSFYQTTEGDQYRNNQSGGDRYHYVKSTSTPTQLPKNNQIDAGQLFEIVAGDTVIAVNGGQWPFSAYAPIKGYQNIVGFEDVSPEELRYLMYIGKESGNVEECKRHFNELLQMENIKRTLLMTPSPKADAAIQSIYRKEDQQPSNPILLGGFHNSQPPVSQNTASSHSASIFGGGSSSASTPSPFAAGGGNPTNIFGGATSPSIFGGNSIPTQTTGNVFGGNSIPAQTSNIFGGSSVSAQTTGNIFGGSSVPTQTTGNIFGGNTVSLQTTGNVFGGAPSGLFSSAAAAVSQSQQATGGFFGSSAAQPPSGLFAAAATNQVFGASHTANIFGSGQQASAPLQPQPFGGFQSTTEPFIQPNLQASLFQREGEASGSVYSLLSDLTDEEKLAFQAKTFTIGKIPIRPPPREMCL